MNLRRSLSIYWTALREWWADRPRFARYEDQTPGDPLLREIVETTLQYFARRAYAEVAETNDGQSRRLGRDAAKERQQA